MHIAEETLPYLVPDEASDLTKVRGALERALWRATLPINRSETPDGRKWVRHVDHVGETVLTRIDHLTDAAIRHLLEAR